MKQTRSHHYGAFTAALLMLGSLLSACQTATSGAQLDARKASQPSVPLSDSLSSNYLMARHAVYANDLNSATNFYTKSLFYDDNDPALLRHAFLTHYQSGNIEKAADIARRMESLNMVMPLASEPALIEAVLSEDWDAVIALSDILAQSDTSIVIAGVAKSWALLAKGQFSAAISEMSDIGTLLENDVGISPAFIELQKVHLLEVGGASDEAITLLRNLRALHNYSSHIQLSIAAAFHRLGEIKAAETILEEHLSTSFDNQRIRAHFAAGTDGLLQPVTINRGLAQSILDTSWLDAEKSIRSLLLARAQLALTIAPDFDAAHFVAAQELLNLNQFDSGTQHLQTISAQSAYFMPAQLVHMNYLRRNDRFDEALSFIQDARKNAPENNRLMLVEADILRSLARHEEAIPLYRQLLGTVFENAMLHRNLAIALERTGQNEEAEQFFLSSLELNPNDPYTLNYLGYWYADTNRHLDRAIAYIEKAVELRPSSGFFADSLGWVHYRLGDYKLAVRWLEKAVQLEPLDAIIIDHLGDAYWQVGRHYEAVYKWRHALEQSPDDELADSLNIKLEEASKPDGQPLEDALKGTAER